MTGPLDNYSHVNSNRQQIGFKQDSSKSLPLVN